MLELRAAELAEAEIRLQEREDAAAALEAHPERVREVERLHRELAARGGRLERREAELEAVQRFAEQETARARAERSALAARTQELEERVRALESREADLEGRLAREEAEVTVRREAVQREELRLAELRERLAQKEDDLAGYVGLVQSSLAAR
ncbi:MAG: hypothetical protein M3168_01575 [Actinomycetota bacterium]|nr:hypothetical protein [Actinomycetota bacterium]